MLNPISLSRSHSVTGYNAVDELYKALPKEVRNTHHHCMPTKSINVKGVSSPRRNSCPGQIEGGGETLIDIDSLSEDILRNALDKLFSAAGDNKQKLTDLFENSNSTLAKGRVKRIAFGYSEALKSVKNDKRSAELKDIMSQLTKLMLKDKLGDDSIFSSHQYEKRKACNELAALENKLVADLDAILSRKGTDLGDKLIDSSVRTFINKYVAQKTGRGYEEIAAKKLEELIDAKSYAILQHYRKGINSHLTPPLERLYREIEAVLKLPYLLKDEYLKTEASKQDDYKGKTDGQRRASISYDNDTEFTTKDTDPSTLKQPTQKESSFTFAPTYAPTFAPVFINFPESTANSAAQGENNNRKNAFTHTPEQKHFGVSSTGTDSGVNQPMYANDMFNLMRSLSQVGNLNKTAINQTTQTTGTSMEDDNLLKNNTNTMQERIFTTKLVIESSGKPETRDASTETTIQHQANSFINERSKPSANRAEIIPTVRTVNAESLVSKQNQPKRLHATQFIPSLDEITKGLADLKKTSFGLNDTKPSKNDEPLKHQSDESIPARIVKQNGPVVMTAAATDIIHSAQTMEGLTTRERLFSAAGNVTTALKDLLGVIPEPTNHVLNETANRKSAQNNTGISNKNSALISPDPLQPVAKNTALGSRGVTGTFIAKEDELLDDTSKKVRQKLRPLLAKDADDANRESSEQNLSTDARNKPNRVPESVVFAPIAPLEKTDSATGINPNVNTKADPSSLENPEQALGNNNDKHRSRPFISTRDGQRRSNHPANMPEIKSFMPERDQNVKPNKLKEEADTKGYTTRHFRDAQES